jgi:hypothetical protein
MKKTINIDGEIYEECTESEFGNTPGGWVNYGTRPHTYYRLKPREPRTCSTTVTVSINGGNHCWVPDVFPAGTRVKVTEILEG